LFTTNTTSRNVGINTASPNAFLHVVTNRTGNDPSSNALYVENTVSGNNSAHAYCTLRTNGSGGGNPCLSFDILGVAGWSMFMDNGDSQALKIRNGWDMGGTLYQTFNRTNNTINTGSSVLFIPRSIVSACKRNVSASWVGGVALIRDLLQSPYITINYTINSGSNGIRPGGYVAPISGMYLMTFTARFQDNGGLVSCMPRLNGNNIFASDYWIPNDGSGRRCCSLSHMVNMNGGDTYDIFSTNGNSIIYMEFSAQLVTSFGV
jgi:hypothetical protein